MLLFYLKLTFTVYTCYFLGGGHIGVTTCQVASIDRHMLNGKHRRNLALTSNLYRSVAYNCEILNGNRPLRGFLTLDAGGLLTLLQFARNFIDLKRCDCLASMKVQYIYLLFFYELLTAVIKIDFTVVHIIFSYFSRGSDKQY